MMLFRFFSYYYVFGGVNDYCRLASLWLVFGVARVTSQHTYVDDGANSHSNDEQLRNIWSIADVVWQQQKLLKDHQQAIDNLNSKCEVFKRQLTIDLNLLRKQSAYRTLLHAVSTIEQKNRGYGSLCVCCYICISPIPTLL